ncbi:hypothetical protein [Seohaeicola zhoushanensis]|uniref:Uncharacterized protein n=1 Tax=Seohaeicola zhoushanensis TaxID=1569283 RepID=A0A8J3M8F9_9RHOB|nr:hypothetical protein [Seohaeicola zhoushanensis]GHF54200.1 hypothetical protein GCM10017056_27060 [Seohaeicola zhoushanensis]
MQVIQTAEYARALYRTHGDRAEAEAASRERMCDAAGKRAEAEDWRAVRRAIRSLRGANES